MLSTQDQLRNFFKSSQGRWVSTRRYYDLIEDESQLIKTYIRVRFLESGCPEFEKVANLHQVESHELDSGAIVSWASRREDQPKKERSTTGSIVFAASKDAIYRDRGFSIKTPVLSTFKMFPSGIILNTEYDGQSFKETVENINHECRTRQTVMMSGDDIVLIGQYVETRK